MSTVFEDDDSLVTLIPSTPTSKGLRLFSPACVIAKPWNPNNSAFGLIFGIAYLDLPPAPRMLHSPSLSVSWKPRARATSSVGIIGEGGRHRVVYRFVVSLGF